MNLSVKNFKTDINKVKWVRTEYAYPIMCEHEKTIESLEADNALLKTAGEDLLEAVKDSNSQLSKSTEVVSLLKDKVKDLEGALKTLDVLTTRSPEWSDIIHKVLTTNSKG